MDSTQYLVYSVLWITIAIFLYVPCICENAQTIWPCKFWSVKEQKDEETFGDFFAAPYWAGLSKLMTIHLFKILVFYVLSNHTEPQIQQLVINAFTLRGCNAGAFLNLCNNHNKNHLTGAS